MINLQEIYKKGLLYHQISTGDKTMLWHDHWVPGKNLSDYIPEYINQNTDSLRVQEFIQDNTWNFVKLRNFLPLDIATTILGIPLQKPDKGDIITLIGAY